MGSYSCANPNKTDRPCHQRASAVAVVAILATLGGCAAIVPAELSGGSIVLRRPFSHEELGRVLERYVDAGGAVDYAGLRTDSEPLERYYFLLSRYSPDSDADLFPTERDRLAYWLNAYNALALKTVIVHEDVTSVTKVRPPLPVFFLPKRFGFFVHRVILGGRSTNLYLLRSRVILRRFRDPRIHFAIDCLCKSCPRLPRRPFTAARLEAQLDEAARAFVGDESNVRIDDSRRAVYVSSIFKWYRDDFTAWLQRQRPDDTPTLIAYLKRYAPESRGEDMARASSYDLSFLPYDWTLRVQVKRE